MESQGRDKLVATGTHVVYVSAPSEFNDQQVATLEIGFVNQSAVPVTLSGDLFTAETDRGDEVQVLSKNEHIETIKAERADLEKSFARSKDMAIRRLSSRTTVSEALGHSREEATRQRQNSNEVLAPVNSAEREQQKMAIEESYVANMNAVAVQEQQKMQLADAYYISKMSVGPEEGASGLISLQLTQKKKPQWIELHLKLGDEVYPFRFDISR